MAGLLLAKGVTGNVRDHSVAEGEEGVLWGQGMKLLRPGLGLGCRR